MRLTYNYHTHTYRCKHASGEDREYIEAAIQGGYQVLGFSDHCPWIFPDSSFISTMRMAPNEVDGYFHSLEQLKKEYQNDIQLLIGFESEYIPELIEKQDEFLSDYPVDYMILGQHFLAPEYDSAYTAIPTQEESVLKKYVDQIIEGVASGRYLYVAHPDLIHFTGAIPIYEKHIIRLCTCLKEAGIPLEINLLGAADHRHYPSSRFFQIAKRIGCTCIIGVDAHAPSQLLDKQGEQLVFQFIQEHSLPLTESFPVK